MRLDLLIRVLFLGRTEGILSQCENNSIIEGSLLLRKESRVLEAKMPITLILLELCKDTTQVIHNFPRRGWQRRSGPQKERGPLDFPQAHLLFLQ